jgi:hypothetical protein
VRNEISMCCNCNLQWPSLSGNRATVGGAVEGRIASWSFTQAELARLASYRAAVAAGFYTDDAYQLGPDETERPDFIGGFLTGLNRTQP